MIKKCLFPVAGYGTRFLPATKAMPKEILPIVNKPLVQYGVEEAAEAGIHEFGFVIILTSATNSNIRLRDQAKRACWPPSAI